MDAVSTTMAVAVQAFTNSMAESNELKLLEYMDPEERRSMAKKLLEAKLKATAGTPNAAVLATVTPSNNSNSNVSALTGEGEEYTP